MAWKILRELPNSEFQEGVVIFRWLKSGQSITVNFGSIVVDDIPPHSDPIASMYRILFTSIGPFSDGGTTTLVSITRRTDRGVLSLASGMK